jgi:hypothetical protein
MMDEHFLTKLAISIESAKSRNNPNNHESPWYEVYNLVLNHFIRHDASFTIAPQLRLSSLFTPEDQWGDNEQKRKYHSKIPDFVLMHSLPVSTNFGEGPVRTIRRQPMLLLENKPHGQAPVQLSDWWLEATVHVRRQAKAAFKTYEGMRKVHVMIAVGDVWTWGAFTREELSPITQSDVSYESDESERDEMDLFETRLTGLVGQFTLGTVLSDAAFDTLHESLVLGIP